MEVDRDQENARGRHRGCSSDCPPRAISASPSVGRGASCPAGAGVLEQLAGALLLVTLVGVIQRIRVVDALRHLVADSNRGEIGQRFEQPEFCLVLERGTEVHSIVESGSRKSIRVAQPLEGRYDEASAVLSPVSVLASSPASSKELP